MTSKLVSASCLLAIVAACSDDAPAPQNPDKLWLTLDGSEIQVRLGGVEPPPF